MEIIRDQNAYALAPQELRKAAEEWEHLCLMHRIIGYLAEYHNLPLTANLPDQKYRPAFLNFYETYHIPFEALVKVAESPVEELVNAPDQVYLFLSSLAQTYELDGECTGVPEKEAFLIQFQDRKQESFDREKSSQCVRLGFFTQVSDNLLICDSAISRDDENLVCLSPAEPGMWRAAVQMVKREESGEMDGTVPAFLLAKSNSCPFSFQQMLGQALLWRKKQNVFTESGIMGVFDEKYYQDPTPFGFPPIPGSNERWVKECGNLLRGYPNACILPHGAISCSGEGEGLYDAYYLENSMGKVIAIAIDFLLYGAE